MMIWEIDRRELSPMAKCCKDTLVRIIKDSYYDTRPVETEEISYHNPVLIALLLGGDIRYRDIEILNKEVEDYGYLKKESGFDIEGLENYEAVSGKSSIQRLQKKKRKELCLDIFE